MPNTSLVLTFDLAPSDVSDTAWHLDIPDSGADLGTLRVGPSRFAQRLGQLVGLPVAVGSPGERVAATMALLDTLDDGQQWFSATRSADPIGAATWMLAAHDALRLMGWNGGQLGGSDRLEALALLRLDRGENPIPPGLPDALHRMSRALETRQPPVALRIRLQQPIDAYSPILRRILDGLAHAGATVVPCPSVEPAAPGDTDLGRLQRALLGLDVDGDVTGDGSLRILDGETPWEAAALALASVGDDALWLVSGEAEVLGRVRARFNRPRIGAQAASRWRPVLQVLPLVLALQFSPQDPQLAFELLTLPVDGRGLAVPRKVSRPLVDALNEAPAIGGPAWDVGLEKGLADFGSAYPDADVDRLRERLDIWFPRAPQAAHSAMALAAVADSVAGWLRGRSVASGSDQLRAAAAVALDLACCLRRLPAAQELTALQVGQLHEVAVGSGLTTDVEAEQGAPPTASSTDAVPQRIPSMVWFGTVAGNAEVPRGLAWTAGERLALQRAGVEVPAEGASRQLEQEGWLRAIAAPQSSLTLVTWQGAGGEAAEPHPLIDLWAACLGERSPSTVTLRARDVLATPNHPAVRALAATRRVGSDGLFTVPKNLVSTERAWSASSIETIVGCPLRWTLQYAAGLRPGPTTDLWEERTLSGTFAHSLFEQLLFADDLDWPTLTPQDAGARMEVLFDRQVPLEATPLTFPRHEALVRQLKAKVRRAAEALVAQLKAGEWAPHAAEKPVAEMDAMLEGQPLTGSIDLLVERPDGRLAVIDLKLGGRSFRWGTLRDGTAVQLAVYAKAAGTSATALPPTAYFIIEDGVLLSTDRSAFPDATIVDGPSPGETLLDVTRAWQEARSVVEAGLVFATREEATARPEPDVLEAVLGAPPSAHPWSEKTPPCRFCDAKRLCSLSVVGGAA